MHSRTQVASELVTADHRTTGNSRCNALGHSQHIWLHTSLLIAKPCARAAHAGLHFIKHQQQTMFITQISQSLQEARFRNAHTAFTLNRFNQDSGRFMIDQALYAFDIIHLGIAKTGQHGTEAFVILRLSSSRQSSESTTMETVFEGDNSESSLSRPVQSCQLDRRLIRFCSAVAEERLTKAASAKELGKSSLLLDVPGVGHMNQRRRLLLNGLHNRRWRIPQDVAAPAREQVQIAFAVRIPNMRPFAAHKCNRVTAIIRDDVLVKQINRGLTL